MTRFGLLLLSGLCLVFVFPVAFLVSGLDGTLLMLRLCYFPARPLKRWELINCKKMVELGHSDLED